MKRNAWSFAVVLCVALPAAAQEQAPQAPQGMPDMSKVGPMSRPIKNEREMHKGIEALIAAAEQAGQKGDIEAGAALVDFPVTMITDDSKGALHMEQVSRDQWIAMMKPFYASMPKEKKPSVKHTIVPLSPTLAYVIGDVTATMGKTKGSWKDVSLVVLKDGHWKFKTQAEAGWGDMSMTGTPETPPSR